MGLKDIKKSLEDIGSGIAEKATSAGSTARDMALSTGSKVASFAAEKGGDLVEKVQEGVEAAKESAQERKLTKLAPVMEAEYCSDDYDLPYLIVIVDEDERKGEQLCDGAIGWLSSQNGTEVLNMYFEFVPDSKINFYPKPQIGAAYYIDSHDPKRYIDLDHLFNITEQDQITELRNIAYSLGAKSCRLLLKNSESTQHSSNASANSSIGLSKLFKGSKIAGKGNAGKQSKERSELKIIFEQQFEGSNNPIPPALSWFADDMEIRSLIDMRCGDNPNSIKKYSVNIDSSKHSAMKRDQAIKIDAALKGIKLAAGAKVQDQLESEMQKSLMFEIEF